MKKSSFFKIVSLLCSLLVIIPILLVPAEEATTDVGTEAEQFAEEDQIQKERIELRNKLENYVYTTKSQLDDNGELGKKISEEDKKTIKDAIKKTIDWFDEFSSSATKEDFEEKIEEIEAIVNPITSKLYSSDPSDEKSTTDEDDELPTHGEL
ncbi:6016_t:CDS:2 [Entrophospora sp. SA101]|nr:6016_t:CDS:2 [Entrophospora sp. SA101]